MKSLPSARISASSVVKRRGGRKYPSESEYPFFCIAMMGTPASERACISRSMVLVLTSKVTARSSPRSCTFLWSSRTRANNRSVRFIGVNLDSVDKPEIAFLVQIQQNDVGHEVTPFERGGS